jgi:hypothetical protein
MTRSKRSTAAPVSYEEESEEDGTDEWASTEGIEADEAAVLEGAPGSSLLPLFGATESAN